MLLQKSYIRFHYWLRLAFGPFNGRIHRLTSPKVRTLRKVSTVRTKRKSAPFRVGYLRWCALSALLLGGIRFFRHLIPSAPSPSLTVGIPRLWGA